MCFFLVLALVHLTKAEHSKYLHSYLHIEYREGDGGGGGGGRGRGWGMISGSTNVSVSVNSINFLTTSALITTD